MSTNVIHLSDRRIKDAMEYLETGGLGEVIGFTSIALEAGQPKVQSDTDMTMALCLLADEALKARRNAKETAP